MTDFLSFMKFAGSDEAQGIGKKVTNFSDEVIQLLREIRDNTAAIRAKQEESDHGK